MVKNSNQRIVFPILDADGDPVTGAAADTPDSEYSIDGAAFADCNDEIHEIATASGVYYLDLLAAETNGDCIAIQVKTATATTKTTVLVFYTSAQSLDTVDTNIDTLVTRVPSAFQFTGNYVNAQIKATDDIDLSATQKTSVNTEVDTALSDIDLDHLIQVTAGAEEPTDGAYLDQIMHKGAGQTFDDTTDSLEAVRDNQAAAAPTAAAIADAVWDEVITQAAHNVANSAALYLRNLWRSIVTAIDTAQAGAAGSITLSATESAVNDYFKGQTIAIFGGTGAGQSRACYGYTGGTKVALTRPAWATNPDNTSEYAIVNVGSTVVAAIDDIDFSATMLTSLNAATPAVTVSDKTGFSLSAAGIDAIHDEVIDTNAPANANTLRETINVIASATAGKLSGGGTNTLTFRDLGDTKARVTATVDPNKNRTAVTQDGT